MKKDQVFPFNKKENTDSLYNLSVGVVCGLCLSILGCISLIVILHFAIERNEITDGSGIIL
jgi:hypothetical protein